MSGGHFNYVEHWISNIADTIELIVEKKGIEQQEDWISDKYPKPMIDYDIFYDATSEQRIEIMSELESLVVALRSCYHRVHEIDYYLSGDTGADSYLERLNKTN